MPNIAVNCLVIKGVKSEIQKCINGLNNKKGNIFDLNKIVQMPDELKNGNTNDLIDENIIIRLKQLIVKERKDKKLCNISRHSLKRYKEPLWYQWAIKNWGTKWNTIEATGKWISDDSYQFIIDTAWNAPTAAICKLAQKYPTLSFVMETVEPLSGVANVLRCQNGQQIENDEYGPHSENYRKLLWDILELPPEDFAN